MKRVRNFKKIVKGLGKSFASMGDALSYSQADLSDSKRVEVFTKLGIAEDLVSEVCFILQSTEHEHTRR